MNDKKSVANDHMPKDLIRQPASNVINEHMQPTNVRPPEPTKPAPSSNNDGGKK